jgi:hypothetical protein
MADCAKFMHFFKNPHAVDAAQCDCYRRIVRDNVLMEIERERDRKREEKREREKTVCR